LLRLWYCCAMYIRQTETKTSSTSEKYTTFRIVDGVREGNFRSLFSTQFFAAKPAVYPKKSHFHDLMSCRCRFHGGTSLS
ncbi:MAG: hypothetical protein LBC55_02485, partial [Desulfovibrio sp.]|nr:hypothetical protein [Desulfovibrio sp.]